MPHGNDFFGLVAPRTKRNGTESYEFCGLKEDGMEEGRAFGRKGLNRRSAAAAVAGVAATCIIAAVTVGVRNRSRIGLSVAEAKLIHGLKSKSELAQKVEWGYTGETRPASWGSLDQTYHRCRDGKLQSPIAINKENVKAGVELPPIRYDNMPSKGIALKLMAKEFWDFGMVVVGLENGPTLTKPGFSRYLEVVPNDALTSVTYQVSSLPALALNYPLLRLKI